ncbi:MAG: hypothetical protein HY226_06160 [Candidatus Vogelbacteria bacterium]|nr:hypothetical protein [Candidatus Vogelbacteria bacterium]
MPNQNKREGKGKVTKKGTEKDLVKTWEAKLKSEGLSDTLRPLEEELNNQDSTPKSAAAAYVEARRFDPKIAKNIAAGYGREGQHKDAAQAIANRFGISIGEAEGLVDEQLQELSSDEDASPTDLWRRFKNRG